MLHPSERDPGPASHTHICRGNLFMGGGATNTVVVPAPRGTRGPCIILLSDVSFFL
jgi:hypothetical protein